MSLRLSSQAPIRQAQNAITAASLGQRVVARGILWPGFYRLWTAMKTVEAVVASIASDTLAEEAAGTPQLSHIHGAYRRYPAWKGASFGRA